MAKIKIYYKNGNKWQHAHTFPNTVGGKIKAAQAKARIKQPTKTVIS